MAAINVQHHRNWKQAQNVLAADFLGFFCSCLVLANVQEPCIALLPLCCGPGVEADQSASMQSFSRENVGCWMSETSSCEVLHPCKIYQCPTRCTDIYIVKLVILEKVMQSIADAQINRSLPPSLTGPGAFMTIQHNIGLPHSMPILCAKTQVCCIFC